AFLGVVVPALLLLGWNLGWYNIVRGSSAMAHSHYEADDAARRSGNNAGESDEPGRASLNRNAGKSETGTVPLMEPDKTVPIPRPYLRPVDGPVCTRERNHGNNSRIIPRRRWRCLQRQKRGPLQPRSSRDRLAGQALGRAEGAKRKAFISMRR